MNPTSPSGTRTNSPALPDRQAVSAVFDALAPEYERFAALELEVGSRLLERLAFQRHPPARILDLGCGTGVSAAALKRQFRKAQVIGLDVSAGMLSGLRRKSGFLRPLHGVVADFGALPLAARSIDLAISNLALPWCGDFVALASGLRRVLKPGGMFVFSSLGPGSMNELTAAAGEGNLRAFPDFRDLGDALQAAGFLQPVMDAEQITLQYPGLDALLRELAGTGASTHFRDWPEFSQSTEKIEDSYLGRRPAGVWPLTFEVVYGVAFGPADGQPIKTREGDIATFSVDSLKASRLHRTVRDPDLS